MNTKNADNQLYTVYYDGDCGVCSFFVRWLNLPSERFHFIPILDGNLKKVKVVDANQNSKEGALAINLLLIHKFPYIRFFVLLIEKSLVFLWIEMLLYALFSKNRSRISKLLRLNSCRIDKKK